MDIPMEGVNVLFAMSQFSRVFYLLNVFKKMQVLTLKKSHLQVKRSWGFHPRRGVSPHCDRPTDYVIIAKRRAVWWDWHWFSFIIPVLRISYPTKNILQNPGVGANTPVTRDFTDPASSGRYTMHGMRGQDTPETACHRNLPLPDI